MYHNAFLKVEDQNKADSGSKGAHATNQLFKQGENVTGNVAAIKAANPKIRESCRKAYRGHSKPPKSKITSLFKIGKCSSWRNSK